MNLPRKILEKVMQIADDFEKRELAQKFKAVSERYRGEKKGNRLLTEQEEAVAYAISRMPATFGAVSSAVSQMQMAISESVEIKNLMDIGAGTGAATLAICEQIEIEQVICLEREDAMMDLGKSLLEVSEKTNVRNATWKQIDLLQEEIKEKADMIVVSYMLNELEEKQRLEVVEKLWNATEQILLIVDPGTPTDFENMIRLKNFLVEKGANVIAPCSMEKGCNLPKDDWCHFICRVERTKLQKNVKVASVPYEDEKFTYLALSKQKIGNTNTRIIRHPIQKTNFIEVKLCENGEIEERIYTKKDKELYKKIKKAKVGDMLA